MYELGGECHGQGCYTVRYRIVQDGIFFQADLGLFSKMANLSCGHIEIDILFNLNLRQKY